MPSEGTTVELSAGPPPTLTKRAVGPAAVARLRTEAAILAAARHPGVVTLLGIDEQHDEAGRVVAAALTTRVAGSRTLATVGPVDPRRAAGMVAALAATVADLHRLGIVHGRITADHVVLAGDGRPVLCGFAEGRSRRGSHERDGAADDVAALGSVLRDLVQSTDAVPDAPLTRRLARRSAATSGLRAALLNLADHASADDPAGRPSAAQLADAIRTAVPDATLTDPRADATEPSAGAPPRPRSTHLALLGGVALVALLAAGAAGLSHDPGPPTPGATSGLTASSTTTSAAPATSTSTSPPSGDGRTALDAAAGCVTDGAQGATVRGGPCPVPIRYHEGILEVGEAAFDLGLPAAAAAVGDFGCRGRVVPAVLDLATGDVFVFDRWATTDTDARTTATTTVTRPRQLLAEPTTDRCHRLVVLDEWGIRHPVAHHTEVTP